jgi:hypothetical protein
MCGGHKKIVICTFKDKAVRTLDENVKMYPRKLGCDNVN